MLNMFVMLCLTTMVLDMGVLYACYIENMEVFRKLFKIVFVLTIVQIVYAGIFLISVC